MIIEDKVQGFNTSKRLPIVFCLDVSPSMGWKEHGNKSSMELLNEAVGNFVKELQQDSKARAAAEVAFVTFSTNIEMDSNFESVGSISVPKFSPVTHGGTQMAAAVLRSIEKIEARRKQLENSEIGYYAPFLVLVTDGNPDNNDDSVKQNRAMSLVKSHCDSHIGAEEIIVPFIIGVGDNVDTKTLNSYSAGFTNGFFHIRGNASKSSQFSKVFKMIGNSTKQSIHLNGSAAKILKTVQNNMNDLLADLAGE